MLTVKSGKMVNIKVWFYYLRIKSGISLNQQIRYDTLRYSRVCYRYVTIITPL